REDDARQAARGRALRRPAGRRDRPDGTPARSRLHRRPTSSGPAALGLRDVEEHTVEVAQERRAAPRLLTRLPNRSGSGVDRPREHGFDVVDREVELEPAGQPSGLVAVERKVEVPLDVVVRGEPDPRFELAVGAVLVEVVQLRPDDALVEGERAGDVFDEHDHGNGHQRASVPRTLPNTTCRRVAWPKARKLNSCSTPGSPRAGWYRSTSEPVENSIRCSASASSSGSRRRSLSTRRAIS